MIFTKVEKKAIIQVIAVGTKATGQQLNQSKLQKLCNDIGIISQYEIQELERMSIFTENELFTILQFNNSLEKSLFFQKILREHNL